MEDGDISVDAVCGLATISFSVVFDVVDFEGDGGGVLISGGVEEGAVVVVSVVGESNNCFPFPVCVLFRFVGLYWFIG